MTSPIPPGHEGLIPHLVCDPCAQAIEFYKAALGAEEVFRMPAPDGQKIMHAQLKINDRLLFLADDFSEFCENAEQMKSRSPKALGASPVTIHQFVEDCDAAIKRAEDAGATVLMPAVDMFWGDRYGLVMDPFGHLWAFATHIADPTPEEMQEAAKAMFAQAQSQ